MIKPGEKSPVFEATAEERAKELLEVLYEFAYRDYHGLTEAEDIYTDELFYDQTKCSGSDCFFYDVENWFREYYDREIEQEMEKKYVEEWKKRNAYIEEYAKVFYKDNKENE